MFMYEHMHTVNDGGDLVDAIGSLPTIWGNQCEPLNYGSNLNYIAYTDYIFNSTFRTVIQLLFI